MLFMTGIDNPELEEVVKSSDLIHQIFARISKSKQYHLGKELELLLKALNNIIVLDPEYIENLIHHNVIIDILNILPASTPMVKSEIMLLLEVMSSELCVE